MKMHKSLTEDRIIEAIESGEYVGFCIACGADADCVEPDACEYECEECGHSSVFGAEELMFYLA